MNSSSGGFCAGTSLSDAVGTGLAGNLAGCAHEGEVSDMSPEIGGWNPAFVFGVAVTVAAIVGGWMWNRAKRPTTNFKANFARDFARDFVVTGITIWVPWLAWRFGWVSSGAAVVIAIGIAVVAPIAIGVVKVIRRR